MKHSIKKQISFTFIGLIVLLVLAFELCNLLFLEKFYLNHKSEILREGMKYLEQSSDFSDEYNLSNVTFLDFCVTENLAVVAINHENDMTYSVNLRQEDAQLLASRQIGRAHV